MEPQGVNEGPPKPYSIARDQFVPDGGNVTEMQAYRFGGKVNRNNFVPFLSDLFAHAGKKQAAVWVQLEWLKVHTGFDYVTTLQNFIDARGMSSFSPAEHASFSEAYSRIPRHDKNTDLPVSLMLNATDWITPWFQDRFREEFSPDVITNPSQIALFTAIDEYRKQP